MSSESVLRVTSLRKTYRQPGGTEVVLDDVSLTLDPGEIVAVRGVSGSGKSTLLQILGGMDRDYQGRVTLGATCLTELGERALTKVRRTQIGFVFQEHHLLPQLSVTQNLLLPYTFCSDAIDYEQLDRLVAQTGIQHLASRKLRQLSGGEAQRVAMVRSLVMGPSLLLCDEPTGNLDHENTLRVIELLRTFAGDKRAVMIATHDDEVAQACSRTLMLSKGRLT